MPRHLRAVLSIAFAALLIALLTLLGFALLRRPYYPALPSPNGYDDFVRGGEAIVGDVSGYRDLGLARLQDMISSNAEPLRLVRLGLTRQCSFPTELGITNFSATIRDMPGLKKLALLLSAEGKLAEMENRPADAAKHYIEGLQLGNETSRGGLLINRLIGIACEAIAGVPSQRWSTVLIAKMLTWCSSNWTNSTKGESPLMKLAAMNEGLPCTKSRNSTILSTGLNPGWK